MEERREFGGLPYEPYSIQLDFMSPIYPSLNKGDVAMLETPAGKVLTLGMDVTVHTVKGYEYVGEQLHPGCRKNGEESFRTMLIAGGLAGVASWVCCYPLDVIKTRFQDQSLSTPSRYTGIVDCFRRSVKQEGYNVLWRGLGTAVAGAFVVNGAIFTAYETALRCLFNYNNNNHAKIKTENTF